MSAPTVKIVSGGDFSNTTVYIDGKPQTDVAAVSWRIDGDDLAYATIEFVNVAVEVEGALDDGIPLERST